jgi:hypothetical protein
MGKRKEKMAEQAVKERRVMKERLKRKGPNPLDRRVEKPFSIDGLDLDDGNPAPEREKVPGPVERVFQVKRRGEPVGAIALKKPEIRKPTLTEQIAFSPYETKDLLVNVKVSGTIKRAMQERAKKYCDGNLSEWLIWAALEFMPRKHNFLVSVEM